MKFFESTAAHYQDLLKRLAPPGAIWVLSNEAGKRWSQLLLGLAAEHSRLHNRLMDLFDDMDPRTVEADMIDAWERNFGLPDPLAPVPTLIAERREALHAKVTAFGGQTVAYFINVAANLGVTITITEPGITVDIGWAHWWWIHAPAEVAVFQVGDEVGSLVPPGTAPDGGFLATYSDLAMQLWFFMQRIKPSHTITLLVN